MYLKRIVICLALIALFSCGNKDFDVALYDDGSVSLSELLKITGSMTDSDKQNLTTKEDCFSFIRKIALEKIILEEVEKVGLDKEPEISDKIAQIKRSAAFNILRQKNVLDKVRVVRSDYDKYSNIYEVYHIVKRTDVLDERQLKRSTELLQNIAKDIKNLDDFKKMAARHSEDITASEGGFLGKIRFGIMDDEIDKVLLTMSEKSISQIVETYAGLHLLWVESIEKISTDEIITDRRLYDLIRSTKIEKIENQWFDKMLSYKDLYINYDGINGRDNEDILVSYNEQYIKRQQLEERISELRQGVFPYPTVSEKKTLLNDLAIQLVLQEKMKDKSVSESAHYIEQVNLKTNYYLMNEYIERYKVVPEISDEDIKNFYAENKNSLFTFKLDDGTVFIQPLSEVERFIMQKLDTIREREARFNLYRELAARYNLTIHPDGIEKFMSKL